MDILSVLPCTMRSQESPGAGKWVNLVTFSGKFTLNNIIFPVENVLNRHDNFFLISGEDG